MLKLANQTAFYRGKVRDVYTINDKYLAMMVSDRISAFDVVLPRPIPYKGQVLNQIAAKALAATRDIVPNWVIDSSFANATIGYKCKTYPVEMIARGHIAGSAWRSYKGGKREICGVTLPDGLNENDALSAAIITPTTKAHEGHDEDISREAIISTGLISKEEYEQLEKYTLALFARGQQMAQERGLILVDTKYEFGRIGNTIYLIDEIHTPDSSRFFYADGFESRQQQGLPQKQLSKEFVREWLMENGFQGREGEAVPTMTDEVVAQISERYMELYNQVTGEAFEPEVMTTEKLNGELESALAKLPD